MPGSLVENRPLGSRVLPSQRPGQDSSGSHVNKQMLVFYSLVHSGERGKSYLRVAGRNGVSTHVTHSASLFLSFLGAGGCQEEKKKKLFGEKGSMFVFWLLVTGHCVCVCVCVLVCRSDYVRNYLGRMMITSSSVSPGLSWSLEGKI